MFNLFTFSLTICAFAGYSEQCSTATFDKTWVETETTVNTATQMVSGCITPETLKLNGTLTKIKVSEQNVPDLNRGAVRNLQDSFEIDFRRNNIEIIREEAFLDLPNVTVIDLADNKIHWIGENAFVNLVSLIRIELNNNNVEIMTRAFNSLPKLQQVHIANNKLKSFDQDWFYRTPSLKWITLRDNQLERIPKSAFIKLPSINQLHFENNLIHHIDPDAFKGLRNLERIYFAQNKLKSFDVNFSTPSKIIYMGIQFNNVTYISDKLLEIVQNSMLKFWVTSNPWQCSCFEKLMKWGLKNNVHIAFKCVQIESVCVIPKANPMECVERTDEEFYSEFSSNFGSEWTCTPGPDY